MDINYEEARVPAYTLPDPLVLSDGSTVGDARIWNEQRRSELLDLFARSVYGRTPADTVDVHAEQRTVDPAALGGAATRVELCLRFGHGDGPSMDLLLYLPNGQSQPAPLFLGLNFRGNHTIHADPTITDAVAEMQACIVIYDKNVSTQSPSGNIYPILLPQSELASCCSWQSWYSSC